MLGCIPRTIGARAVAALAALVFSGAPRVAIALRTGPEHVCQCRSHGEGHRCACPICAAQARRARRGQLEKLPPCHQKLAREELAREEQRESASGDLPCLEPRCGLDDPRGDAPSTETFVAPRALSLAPPHTAETLAPPSDAARESPAVPDVPPPIPVR